METMTEAQTEQFDPSDIRPPPGFTLDPAPGESGSEATPAKGLSDADVGLAPGEVGDLATQSKRRAGRPKKAPIVAGSSPPVFLLDREIDRGKGYVRFD